MNATPQKIERPPREAWAGNVLLKNLKEFIAETVAERVTLQVREEIAKLGLSTEPNALAIRTARGLGLSELAAAAGIDPGTLSKIEAGLTRNPRRFVLARIADALGVDPGKYREAVARSYEQRARERRTA